MSTHSPEQRTTTTSGHPAGTSRRWPRALQVLSVLNLVLIFVQAVTAGNVLSGNRALVVAHEVVGANVIGFVSIGQIVVAALARRARLVPSWLVVLAVVTFALVVAQVYLGFDGRLAIHVPNALVVFAAQGVMLVPAGTGPPSDPGRR